jgi:hypothetical protein
MLARRHSFSVTRPDGGQAPYFCIFEADFTDAVAMAAAMQSAAGRAVADDVKNYVTTPPIVVTYKIES